MKISLSFTLLASLVAVTFASTVADVLVDIQEVFNQLTAYHKTIAALPDTGGSLLSAFALHSGGHSVVAALNKGTADVNDLPKPLSKADADKMMLAVEGIEPLISDCTNAGIAKRDTFRAVPIVGDLVNLVAQYHLMNLKVSASKFADAGVAAAPDDHVGTLKSLKALSNAAIDHAFAAFS